jgi:hypothetical protein
MFTQNKMKKIVYVAQGFTAGLVDLTLAIRQPDATLVTPVIAFTEQGNGVYVATFTPTQVGNYQFSITSVSNGDNFIKAEDCIAFDSTDVKNDVDTSTTSIETAVAGVKNDLDLSVTTINNNVATVKADVDSSTTAIQSSIASVQTTVNQIKASETKQGGYIA